MLPEKSGMKGFTLIEVIVVLALISLVATLSIPRFDNFLFSNQLKSSSRKVIGIVSQISQEAVRTRTGSVLVFDLSENIVRADFQPGEVLEKPKTYLTFPASVRIVDITSVHGGKRNQGQIKLHFSSKGYIDKTYIHLRDDEGDNMTVMISPFLGVIKIVDSYVELSGEERI